jgi:hypothetical protein
LASNYARISTDHLRRYGTDIDEYGPTLLQNLYSDRTHFIMEILQNAEDKEATKIDFRLFADRLEIRHNAPRLFSEDDVQSICALARSTKNELTSIGRFGIGFKSVYAFTRTPQVHSGDEHFVIKSYVRPQASGKAQPREEGTLFVLPFDHAEISPTQARQEVARGLTQLDARSLLFLSHLKEISWSNGDASGSHKLEETAWASKASASKRAAGTPPVQAIVRRITVAEAKRPPKVNEWLVVRRAATFSAAKASADRYVECAFAVERQGTKLAVVQEYGARLAVFFVTNLATGLGFLLQGPFRTTTTREDVKVDDEHNQKCAAMLADLVVDSFIVLRDNGLLDGPCFRRIFPPAHGHLARDALLAPVRERLVNALFDTALLPTDDGRHVTSRDAIMAHTTEIRDLLPREQLESLFGKSKALIDWDVYAGRDEEFRRLLRERPGLVYVDDDALVKKLGENPALLSAQSDKWLCDLYAYLDTRHYLLGRQPNFLAVPWIRLQDGTHVRPPMRPGDATAWFAPEQGSSERPCVRKSVAAHTRARSFLEKLGVKQVAIDTEVLHSVLPRYQNPSAPKTMRYDADLQRISQAWAGVPPERRDDLRDGLNGTAWVQVQSADGKQTTFKRPSECYLETPETRLFLKGNPDAWFPTAAAAALATVLEATGAALAPRVRVRRANQAGYVTVVGRHGWHERGLNGFDPEFQIDGLDFALRNPDVERARYIWNQLLIPHNHCIAGEVQSSSLQSYQQSTTVEKTSNVGKLVQSLEWIPDAEGGFVSPSGLSMNDLPEGFIRDRDLASALGLSLGVETSAVAKDLHLPEELVAIMRDHPKETAEMLRRLQREVAAKRLGAGQAVVDFGKEFTEAFSKPGHVDLEASQTPESADQLPNPAIRQARVRQAIQDAIGDEPPASERWAVVPRKVWEAKEFEPRVFLEREYAGRCQICEAVFPKRDATPYFEGLYIAKHVAARWVDRPGNVLCLCATCAAKFEHGTVSAEKPGEQVLAVQVSSASTKADLCLRVALCGKVEAIRFSPRHFIELQELLRTAPTTPTAS